MLEKNNHIIIRLNHITILLALLMATAAKAQIPKLSSYPGAHATVFLDFDGHTVSGTLWNWSGTIYAQPAELTPAAIQEIFNRVSEDFRPFNLNITTDSTVYLSAPYNQRARVIVTPTSQWYGSAGGVSIVGSFTFGDETPAWVFSKLLGNNSKIVAEAISHETGHTLGLQHQSDYDANCKRIAEYGVGSGSGEIGWAPIMGVGYYKNLTTWHNGTSVVGCNYIQNDLEVITSAKNGFGYRDDDHANDANEATAINMDGVSFLVDGIINRSGDIDAFQFSIPANANFRLNAIPENVGSGNSGANVDIRIKILDSNKDTIGVYNPSTLLDAGIDTSLYAGSYYVLVDGVGNANKSEYGSLGYYSMTGMVNSVLPLHQFKLSGSSVGSDHLLNWSLKSDEPLKSIVVESSANGRDFHPLVILNPGVRSFRYKSLGTITRYRLKAIMQAGEKEYFSNILTLRDNGQTSAIQLLSNIVTTTVDIKSDGSYPYQLADATGRIILKGTLQSGLNQLTVPQDTHGILFLRLAGRIERLFKAR